MNYVFLESILFFTHTSKKDCITARKNCKKHYGNERKLEISARIQCSSYQDAQKKERET